MKKFDKKALSEVYCLIELLDEESYQKIPENLVYGIKKNMANSSGEATHDCIFILRMVSPDIQKSAISSAIIQQ